MKAINPGWASGKAIKSLQDHLSDVIGNPVAAHTTNNPFIAQPFRTEVADNIASAFSSNNTLGPFGLGNYTTMAKKVFGGGIK